MLRDYERLMFTFFKRRKRQANEAGARRHGSKALRIPSPALQPIRFLGVANLAGAANPAAMILAPVILVVVIRAPVMVAAAGESDFICSGLPWPFRAIFCGNWHNC